MCGRYYAKLFREGWQEFSNQAHDNYLDPAANAIFRSLLRVRYDIHPHGLDQIDPTGGGILFLPNHPGYTDPAIETTELYERYHARPVMAEDQSNPLTSIARPFYVPDVDHPDAHTQERLDKLVDDLAAFLDKGGNLILYPEGRLTRNLPELGGQSIVEAILKKRNQTRIVLAQMNGHGGSSFGPGPTGDFPDLKTVITKRLMDLAYNWLYFKPMPKRRIDIKYVEPKDFPRTTRHEINPYLQKFYRDQLKPNLYVPYRFDEPQQVVQVPYSIQPQMKTEGDVNQVPAAVREKVLQKIREMTGTTKPIENDHKLSDLGMNSLDVTDFTDWINEQFGRNNKLNVATVRDALLVANGQQTSTGAKVSPPAGPYLRDQGTGKPLTLSPNVHDLLDGLLWQMKHNPDKVILMDETTGPMTARELFIGVKLFSKRIKKMKGDKIGIMMPASSAAYLLYYSVLFAGKTPVMVPFKAGERAVKYAMDNVGVKTILTSSTFVDKLAEPPQNVKFGKEISGRYQFLENIRDNIPSWEKMYTLAIAQRKLFWTSLHKPPTKPDDTSVILFTSGTTGNPKAVAYTHRKELTNIRDLLQVMDITDRDRVMTIAPPFHSLGHRLATMGVTLGVPQVFHTNPEEGAQISKISSLYKPTIVVGTPKFLNAIAAGADPGDLDSYRLGVVGADKLSPDIVQNVRKKSTKIILAEGYGTTEALPVVFLNPPNAAHLGTLGKPLPHVDAIVVDPEALERGEIKEVPKGKVGVMLFAPKKGDPEHSTIFDGYMNYEGKQPFVKRPGDDRNWFDSGDLGAELPDGYFEFHGRLKRSRKKGGEMVPLDGLENILLTDSVFEEKPGDADNGKFKVAVVATPKEPDPDFVLFTTRDISVAQANAYLQQEGAASVWRVQKVVKVHEIPEGATGKTDYKPYERLLKDPNWERFVHNGVLEPDWENATASLPPPQQQAPAQPVAAVAH